MLPDNLSVSLTCDHSSWRFQAPLHWLPMGTIFSVFGRSSHEAKTAAGKKSPNITSKDRAVLDLKIARDKLNKYRKKVRFMWRLSSTQTVFSDHSDILIIVIVVELARTRVCAPHRTGETINNREEKRSGALGFEATEV